MLLVPPCIINRLGNDELIVLLKSHGLADDGEREDHISRIQEYYKTSSRENSTCKLLTSCVLDAYYAIPEKTRNAIVTCIVNIIAYIAYMFISSWYNYSISYADEGYKMMIKEKNLIERIKNELYYWNNNNGDNQIDYTLCSITR
eukprot:g129.t1